MPISSLRRPSWRSRHRRPPFEGAPQEYHRAAIRMGAGWRPSDVARLLGCDPMLLHELLREPEFVELFKAYRELAHTPYEACLRHLTEIALALLAEAMQEGDVDVVRYFLRERLEGRDPARELAKTLLAGLERQKALATFVQDARDTGTEWPDPEPSAQRQRKPVDPVLRRVYRAAAKLRAGMVEEHAALLEGEELNGTPSPRAHIHLIRLPEAETAIGRWLPELDIDTSSWAWPEGP